MWFAWECFKRFYSSFLLGAEATFPAGLSEEEEKWQTNTSSVCKSDVLTVRRPVFVPIKCSGTLCISSAAVARLMCQQHPSLHLPSLPHSFQGNMCAGILPQLRQGLGRSAVGTECGKTEGPALSPSLTDTQPHSHLLLLKLPPSCLTLTVTLPPTFTHHIFCFASYSHHIILFVLFFRMQNGPFIIFFHRFILFSPSQPATQKRRSFCS